MLFNVLFYKYFKKNYMNIIGFILIICIIYPLQAVGLSRLYGNLFDIVNKNNLRASFFDIKNIFKKNIAGYMLLIIFIYIILAILFLSKNYLETIIIPDYFKYLRTLFFDNYINKYSNNFKDVEIGQIVSKIFELNLSVINLFLNISNYFLATCIGLLSILIYFYFLSWKIGTLFLLAIILIISVYYFYGKNQINNSLKKFKILYENNEKLTDKLSNLLNIYINNEQQGEIDRFLYNENRFRKQFIKNYWIEKKNISLCDVIITLFSILILVCSYNLFKNKDISTISFISIIVALGSSIEYLFMLNGEVSSSIYQFGIIKSNEKLLGEILNYKKKNLNNIKLNKGNIEFKNIFFSYNNDGHILKNFNYKIENGQKVAIIGQSGSGKTTIMKLLIHLNEANKGDIYIDNNEIKTIETEYLRSKIIYVNQRTVLFNRTILENMKYGTNKNNEDIVNLLNKYDLMRVFNKLPKSIHSQSGVNGNNLSLGMQKITIIIRGILKDGLIYAFDEPLTSLDTNTRKNVIKMLINELKGKTLIIITHDKEILPYMDKTLKIIKN